MLSTDKLKTQITAIPYGTTDYPKEWLDFTDAPETLYAVGNLSLLKRRKLTVVGSRRTPANALKLGANIAKELCGTFVIVTGTADGGDTAAIEGGLAGGGVICVLAGGFSAIPQSNLALLERVAKEGLLLAVHSFDTPVRNFSYEYRNKLLAALGEGTFVLGAGEKSGALTTARYAWKLKRPLFAFPYPPNSAVGAGCNALLKSGGNLVENAEDIAKKFGIAVTVQKPSADLSAEEAKLYGALQELSEAHASELAAKTGIPVFKLRAMLSALEVKGLAVSLGGNRYGVV